METVWNVAAEIILLSSFVLVPAGIVIMSTARGPRKRRRFVTGLIVMLAPLAATLLCLAVIHLTGAGNS